MGGPRGEGIRSGNSKFRVKNNEITKNMWSHPFPTPFPSWGKRKCVYPYKTMGFWRYLGCHIKFFKALYSCRFRVEKRQAEATLFRNGRRPVCPFAHRRKVLAYIQWFMMSCWSAWSAQTEPFNEELTPRVGIREESTLHQHSLLLNVFMLSSSFFLINSLINLLVYFTAKMKQLLSVNSRNSSYSSE